MTDTVDTPAPPSGMIAAVGSVLITPWNLGKRTEFTMDEKGIYHDTKGFDPAAAWATAIAAEREGDDVMVS